MNFKEPTAWVPISIIGVGLLALASFGIVKSLRKNTAGEHVAIVPESSGNQREHNLGAARDAFNAFLAATTPEHMAQHVIGGSSRIEDIRAYLSTHGDFPAARETDLIEAFPTSDEDIPRGIVSLTYLQLEPVSLLPRNPMITDDVRVGLRPPDPLSQVGILESRKEPEQKSALALFKIEKNQTLLDWDTFVQTWDRSLRSFSDGEAGDGPARFRGIISQDKPVFENDEPIDSSIIRIQDPLHPTDVIRIREDKYDTVSNLMRSSPRDLANDPTASWKPRTATVDLVRNPDTGRISISSFVCWEFLGVGGTEGNAGKMANN